MPGEAIIGKVAVKVIPDTTKFKKELEGQLKKIEKSLKDIKVSIAPEVDDAQVRAAAKKAREVAQAEMKDLKLGVDLDNQDSINKAIARLNAELTKLRENHILEVGLNQHDIQDKLAWLHGKLDEVRHIELSVDEFNDDSVRRAFNQINSEIEKLNEHKVQIHLDEESLWKERDRLQKILDERLQIKAELEQEAKAKAIAETQAMLNAVQAQMRNLVIGASLPPGEAEKLKREVETTLLRINDLQVKIGAELDPIAKRKLELEVEALRATIGDLKVKLNPELDDKKVATTEGALKLLTRPRSVDIKPVINSRAARFVATTLDRLSGFRQGRQTVDMLKSFLTNLDLLAPKIATVGLGIVGIGAGALSSAANLFALSSALASIGGASIALPGIMAGLGIGVLASAVALKDFNKQFADFQIGIGKKTPAGQAWKQLQDMMSEEFWAKAKKPIGELITELFPKLQKGLVQISSSLGAWWGSLATGLKSALAPRMAGMFDNLDKSIQIATGSTGSLANIIGILGDIGAKQLPRLADWFVKVTNNFSDWLTEAEKTGKLQEYIDNAITAIKNLGRIAVDVYQIFSAINQAAKNALGKDALGALADSLDRVKKIVQGDTFQKELTRVFKAAKSAMQEIYDRAGPALELAFKNLSHTLQHVLPQAGAAIGSLAGGLLDAFNQPHLQNGIRNFFGSIMVFADTIRPAFKDVGDAVGSVLNLMSTFIEVTAGPAASALSTISDVVKILADGIRPFIEKFIPAVSNLFDAISPSIKKVATAVSDFFDGPGGRAITKFVQDITPGVKKLAEFFGDLAGAVIDWLSANAGDILDTWSQWFNAVSDWVDKHKDTIIAVFKGILDVIKELVTNLPLLTTALAVFIGLKLAAAISNMEGLATGIGKVSKAIWGMPGGPYIAAIAAAIVAIGLALPTSDDWKPDNLSTAGDAMFNLADGANAALGPLGLLWDLLFGDPEGIADYSGGGIPDYSQPQNIPKDSQGRHNGDAPLDPQSSFPNLPGYVTPEQLDAAQKQFDIFDQMYQAFMDGLIHKGDESSDAIAGTLGGLFNDMKGRWDDDAPRLGQTWDQFWENDVYAKLKDQIGPDSARALTDMLRSMQGNLDQWAPLFGGDFTNLFDGLINDIANGDMPAELGVQLASMSTNLGDFGGAFTGQFAAMWDTANQIGGTQGDQMKVQLANMLGSMDGNARDGMSKIQRTWSEGWGGIQGSTRIGADGVTAEVGKLPPRLPGAMGDTSTLLYGSGQELMNGFINGIFSKIKAIAAAAKAAASTATTSARDALQIASPSKVFHEIGGFVSEGLANGILDSAHKVRNAMTEISSNMTVGQKNTALANGELMAPEQYTQQKVLIYNAAPGNSLNAEEDLFAAAERARMGW